MKIPIAPIPPPFKAFVMWLKNRRGIDLYGSINFTRGFRVGEVTVTPEIMETLVKMATPKSPRNKHPAEKQSELAVAE